MYVQSLFSISHDREEQDQSLVLDALKNKIKVWYSMRSRICDWRSGEMLLESKLTWGSDHAYKDGIYWFVLRSCRSIISS